MKVLKITLALTFCLFIMSSCGSSKKEVDGHKKVEESYKDFKERNPDND